MVTQFVVYFHELRNAHSHSYSYMLVNRILLGPVKAQRTTWRRKPYLLR